MLGVLSLGAVGIYESQPGKTLARDLANEVRSLAQRSAEAAKEIKRLITASVERVEQGHQVSSSASDTM